MQKRHDFDNLLRPRLEIRHLTLLLAIDQAGSVTGAADLLGITQPALSRQIREAERRLGQPLYDRSRKKLRLTPAGESLLGSARMLLSDLRWAEADAIEMPAQPTELVWLGAGAYSDLPWLAAFLGHLRERRPQTETVVARNGNASLLEALHAREIDLALVPGPVEGSGHRVVPLFEDELIAFLPPDHPLAAKPFLEAQDLVDPLYITYSMTTLKGFETDRLLRPAMLWPRRLMQVELTGSILDLVAGGVGITVLSRWAGMRAVRQGRVVARRLTHEGLFIPWSAVVRLQDGSELGPLAYAELLAAWCAGAPDAFAEA